MKPRVLVVDDEPDFVQLLEYNLLQQGFEVFTASNGIEALHQARRVLPDVVLLDLMLPDIDGFSVFEILRLQPSTAVTPIIVISALNGPTVNGRSIELGADCFLRKPVDLQTLGHAVWNAVRQHREIALVRLNDTEGDRR